MTRKKYFVRNSFREIEYNDTIPLDSRIKVTDGIKLIHYWFNDQPLTQEPITKQRKPPLPKNFSWAHSKVLPYFVVYHLPLNFYFFAVLALHRLGK